MDLVFRGYMTALRSYEVNLLEMGQIALQLAELHLGAPLYFLPVIAGSYETSDMIIM